MVKCQSQRESHRACLSASADAGGAAFTAPSPVSRFSSVSSAAFAAGTSSRLLVTSTEKTRSLRSVGQPAKSLSATFPSSYALLCGAGHAFRAQSELRPIAAGTSLRHLADGLPAIEAWLPPPTPARLMLGPVAACALRGTNRCGPLPLPPHSHLAASTPPPASARCLLRSTPMQLRVAPDSAAGWLAVLCAAFAAVPLTLLPIVPISCQLR